MGGLTPLIALPCLIAVSILVTVWFHGQGLSPDAGFYIKAGKGDPVPIPFHFRFLLPKILRDFEPGWSGVCLASLVSFPIVTGYYAATMGLGLQGCLMAAFLAVALPMVRTNYILPILVDAPALVLTTLAAALALHGYTWTAVAVVLVASAIKETAGPFAAAFAWSPVLLVGLIVPASRMFFKRAEQTDERYRNVVTKVRLQKRGQILRIDKMLLPWGIASAAILAPSKETVAATALGYAQLLIATDSTRLFQWAAPAVCVSAAAVIPENYYIPLAILHLLNPFHGDV